MEKVTKVLFCSANPADLSRLRLDKEYREIEHSLLASNFRDRFELLSIWATTTQDLLQKVLSVDPNIVHFSGHGTSSGIVLENGIGDQVIVSKEGLGALFELFLGKVTCVVLNSCYSDDQAKLIKSFVPYVIGMSHTVPDSTAIAFSSGFYKAIGAGKDIPMSFKAGVASIKLEGLPSAEIPLLLKNGVLLKRKIAHMTLPQHNAVGHTDSDKSVIVLDVDDFTVINKKFGRDVGNEIKAIIFDVISSFFSEVTIPCIHNWIVPYSDEHYIVINRDLSASIEIAEQIREKIFNYNWQSVSPALFVSVCCGVVSYNSKDTPEEILIKALLGVKEAKFRSKNSMAIGPKYLPSGSNHLIESVMDYCSGVSYEVNYSGHIRNFWDDVTEYTSRQFEYIQNFLC